MRLSREPKLTELDRILERLEKHQRFIYMLGWLYIAEQELMEHLFYETMIKLSKRRSPLDRNDLEALEKVEIASAMVRYCHENTYTTTVSSEKDERPSIFKELDQLPLGKREALFLTYILGLSYEEAATILRRSVVELEADGYSGLLLLGAVWGRVPVSTGCEQYRNKYLAYLDRKMLRPEKVEFEVHVYHCEDCQEALSSLQDIKFQLVEIAEEVNRVNLPANGLIPIRERLRERELHRQNQKKKRLKAFVGLAAIVGLLVGTEVVSGFFSQTYYTWTEEDEELLAFVEKDVADIVNLSSESEGVKITVKSVIADETQTLLFYEIEDTTADQQYIMSYGDGVAVENEMKIMDMQTYPAYYLPDLESTINKEEKNVYHGKISLLPIIENKATIQLKITSLMKLDGSMEAQWGYSNEYKTGDWTFNIPVTKIPSKEYGLSAETEVEGVPVRFDKLVIAPTVTLLQYSFKYDEMNQEKTINAINFGDLQVNGKSAKTNIYYNGFVREQTDPDWMSHQVSYESILGVNPKEVRVMLQSATLSVNERLSVTIDPLAGFPQTFEYAGSTISLDQLKVGNPTTIEFSDPQIEGRAYESFWFNFIGEDENMPLAFSGDIEQIIVDQEGKTYDDTLSPNDFMEIGQPRYFVTKQRLQIEGNNIIPKRMDLLGYQTTKYLDEELVIQVKENKNDK